MDFTNTTIAPSTTNDSFGEESDEMDFLLPPIDDDEHREYTLVLDLDETLVHFNPERRLYHVRPGCFQFLEELSKVYEIVVFTASTCGTADFILDRLDAKC